MSFHPIVVDKDDFINVVLDNRVESIILELGLYICSNIELIFV